MLESAEANPPRSLRFDSKLTGVGGIDEELEKVSTVFEMCLCVCVCACVCIV